MKKLVSVLCFVLALCVALSACSTDTHEHQHSHEDEALVGIDPERANIEDYDLTIACYMQGSMPLSVIDHFEETYGLKVRIISYSENEFYALDLKLMSEDTSIDIFTTGTLDIYKYIQKGYFSDLKSYDSLKTRIESNNYTKVACAYKDTYYGIPLFPNLIEYTTTLRSYQMENIRLAEGVYNDPEGEELFKVFKHLYNVGDTLDNTFYEGRYVSIVDEYMIISPYSNNKDTAVLLLEMIFDFTNGDLELYSIKGNPVICHNPYPETEDLSGAYLSWNYNNRSALSALFEACNQVLTTDGTDETLLKLAQETARQIRMRLEG